MQQDSMISTRTMKQLSSQPQFSADIFTPPPYSSIFFRPSPSPTLFTAPSSSCDVKSTRNTSRTTEEAAKNLTQLMSEHKELLSRHALCLHQLRKTFKESETLRQENTNLRLANAELRKHVNLLIQLTMENQNRYQTPSFSEKHGPSSLSLFPEKCGDMFEKERECGSLSEGMSRSPMSMSDSQSPQENEKDEDTRVTLPKSISVRSNGYLKYDDSSALRCATRIRASTPINGPKKVYVRGGGKKDGPIELEVYNQGMFKTELCNKWQETGSCPYGDHCQFAHGIGELRPVIRHPRYKTEVCRMILSGDPCPYGHRCHFRHALTDEEKLSLQLRLE